MAEGSTTTGTLKRGLKVGDQVHKDFELRECTAGDYFAAEASSDSSKPITFQASLVAQQLVRVGTFEGPFTLSMLSKLHPSDVQILIKARQELEAQGEAEQPG